VALLLDAWNVSDRRLITDADVDHELHHRH